MIEIQMMQEKASQLSPSPSFNSYSSETLGEIAARVLQELRISDPSLSISDADTLLDSWESRPFNQPDYTPNDHVDGGGDDDDFEFASVSRDPDSSPVSADDIFCNGQIRPVYPIFDRNLLFNLPHFAPRNDGVEDASISPTPKTEETAPVRRRRPPLRKLMFEERETWSCSSSTSDADENDLGGVTPGTYCAWSPKSKRPGKKSTSTGSSSKRWKLRDLLLGNGSHGDRKEALVFLRSNKVAQEVSKPGADAEHCMRNEGMNRAKEGRETKRKSSLPYRHELVGLFSNVNGIGRHLHPF